MNRNDIPRIKNAGIGHYILSMLMLGSVLFAATDAHAMKISEAEKLPIREQASYVLDVIDAHLNLIAEKNLDLAKKTSIYMHGPSKVNGIYQGVVDIMGTFDYFKQKGLAEKVDVELVCRLAMDRFWKENELKGNDGSIANSSMFFPKGYQVAYNPVKDDNNKVAQNPPATKSTAVAEK